MPDADPAPIPAETPSPTPAAAPASKRPRRPLWPWFAAALSGIMLGLSFPPFEQTWMIWIALCPLICALWFGAWKLPRGGFKMRTLEEARAAALLDETARIGHGRAFLLGWVAGLGHFGISLFWIHTVHIAAWLTMPLYLAVYTGLWAMFFNALCQPRRRWGIKFQRRAQPPDSVERPVWLSSTHNLWLALLAGMAWTALEWMRGWMLTGFGWNGLGVATYANPPLMQASALVGVTGLSLPLVLVSVVAVATINRFRHELGRVRIRPHLDFSLSMALVVIWFSYGTNALFHAPPTDTRKLRVALVQPNTPLSVHRDFSRMDRVFDQLRPLTIAAAASGPDLVIWPECATPAGLFTHRPSLDFWDEMRNLGSFNFLSGTVYDEWPDPSANPDPEARGKSYNSAMLVKRREEGFQIYNKIHLVPFGEFLPLRRQLPPLAWMLRDLIPADFDAGREFTLLETQDPEVKLAPLICFEDTVPHLARHFILAGGEMFVNLTNDGWFAESAASRQHLINSLFRCTENRRPMVRCANTGVSAFIDEYGRIRDYIADEEGNTFTAQMRVFTMDLPPEGAPAVITPFTRWGNWFSALCFALSVLYMGMAIFRKLRSGDGRTNLPSVP